MADLFNSAKINVIAGNGGHGVASVHREKLSLWVGPMVGTVAVVVL